MQTTIPAPAPWWRHRWPWLLMAGPGIVAVAATYTGWLAYQGQDALVVGDYYKQGKAINQDLRRDRAAAGLGLSMELEYDPASSELRGRIRSRSQAAQPATVQLHLSHATLPDKDIKLLLRPNADGVFHVALPMLERSRWVVLAEGEQRDWRLAGAWQWPAQRSVTLRADAE